MASKHPLHSDGVIEPCKQDTSQHELRKSLQLKGVEPNSQGAPTEGQQGLSRKRDQDALGISIETDKRQKRVHQNCLTVPSRADQVNHWIQFQEWPQASSKMFARTRMQAREKSLLKRSFDGPSYPSQTTTQGRDGKSVAYRLPAYEELLRLQGFDMGLERAGPSENSLKEIKDLLSQEPALPQNSLFADDKYAYTLDKIRIRNEARVVRDIGPLIVPSAEHTEGEHMKYLVESVDEGWNQSVPITQVRPQPDFSVGFNRDAFTEEQLARIQDILGDSLSVLSLFKSTWYMYFPFMSAEAKCGTGGLDIADRQNAHSMGIAVRAIVNLYQLVGRQQEINREILAFSVCYDNLNVRIHGYYPVVKEKITYHRYKIKSIDLGEGDDRWIAFKFITSVYKTWAGKHLQRILSILDELPDRVPDDNASLPPEPMM